MLRYYDYSKLVDAYYLDTNYEYFVFKGVKYRKTQKMRFIFNFKTYFPMISYSITAIIVGLLDLSLWILVIALIIRWPISSYCRDKFVEEALKNIIEDNKEENKKEEINPL